MRLVFLILLLSVRLNAQDFYDEEVSGEECACDCTTYIQSEETQSCPEPEIFVPLDDDSEVENA